MPVNGLLAESCAVVLSSTELMGSKRSFATMNADVGISTSPYMAAFQGFRDALDDHHERRERVTKASRDITAASKKM